MAACLTNITEIGRDDCIGASRTVINDNFLNIKKSVIKLSLIIF